MKIIGTGLGHARARAATLVLFTGKTPTGWGKLPVARSLATILGHEIAWPLLPGVDSADNDTGESGDRRGEEKISRQWAVSGRR